MRTTLMSFFLLVFSHLGFSQERVLTVGIQAKPLIPSDVITDRTITQFQNNYAFTMTNRPGYSFGMVLRKGFNDRFSFETGINYVSRNFDLTIEDQTGSVVSQDNRFQIIGYEIPMLGLVYVRLSKEIYMNAAFGASIDFFPSDVGTTSETIYHISQRRAWFMPSLLANIGWEYRTRNLGYFYLGGSFHRPFTNIYFTGVRYEPEPQLTESIFQVSGSYLTLDLRYFFHEPPQEKKPKKEKKDLKYYRKMQKKAEKEKKKKNN